MLTRSTSSGVRRLSPTDALTLHRGDLIRVTRPGHRRRRLASVTGRPGKVAGGHWVSVPFAYARFEHGTLVLGRLDHFAILPGERIERAGR